MEKNKRRYLRLLNKHDKIDKQIIGLVKRDELSISCVYVGVNKDEAV
jgi:uncharacterized protein YdcH (DUF465 family)